MIKMADKVERKMKISWNIPLAILVGLGVYALFKSFSVSIELWLFLIVILLLLIYFELLDKCKGKTK